MPTRQAKAMDRTVWIAGPGGRWEAAVTPGGQYMPGWCDQRPDDWHTRYAVWGLPGEGWPAFRWRMVRGMVAAIRRGMTTDIQERVAIRALRRCPPPNTFPGNTREER